MKGELFVISAPSGAGKTTVLKKVLASLESVVFSISHTTRKPRDGEEDGQDYFFVTEQDFISLREADGFLEWAEVHGNLYGTSREAIESFISDGLDVILDIDVQGARQLREDSNINGHFIFIIPPSWQELQKRLISRGTENEEALTIRHANAKKEMASLPLYDFVIVNDLLDNAVDMLRSIIIAQRSKTRRTLSGKSMDVTTFFQPS
jgi:guanylate kinase